MRIAWLADMTADPPGGAELTEAEFAAAAPEGIGIVPIDPAEVEAIRDCDRAVVHNCVSYPPETVAALDQIPTLRYHHDLARYEKRELAEWLAANAVHVFCSPIQQARYGLPEEWPNIPPAVDIARFAYRSSNGHRDGNCSIAAWMNPGKGAARVEAAARRLGEIDVYGFGPFMPVGEGIRPSGYIPPDRVQEILWKYARFVFLPDWVEPFGRSVLEAHAAGCELLINNMVGVRYWIERRPARLLTAAADFWRVAVGEAVRV